MDELSKILPRLSLREDQFAARARDAFRQSEEVGEQLKRLTEYRRDYHAANAVVPALMIDAQCFVDRLDVSIKELDRRYERLFRVAMAEENRWKNARARRMALEKLITKRTKELHAKKLRREINLAESLQGSHKFLNAKKDRY